MFGAHNNCQSNTRISILTLRVRQAHLRTLHRRTHELVLMVSAGRRPHLEAHVELVLRSRDRLEIVPALLRVVRDRVTRSNADLLLPELIGRAPRRDAHDRRRIARA